MKQIKILALADLHFTEHKPDCRLPDENWMQVQAQKVNWLAQLIQDKNVDFVAIAGDIFDTWKSAKEDSQSGNSIPFVNNVMKWLKTLRDATKSKKLLTVAGNHDLPTNSYTELHRAPYYTCMVADIVTDCDKVLKSEEGYRFGGYAYTKTAVMTEPCEIVLAHKGLYLEEKPFDDAPDSGNVEVFIKKLPKECRLLIAGDYHKPFITTINGTTIVNCGNLLRMRADQIDYEPTVKIITMNAIESIVELFPVPLLNPVRRDYIDKQKEERAKLNEVIGSIDGNFEVTENFKENFYNLTKDLHNKEAINSLFERTLQ